MTSRAQIDEGLQVIDSWSNRLSFSFVQEGSGLSFGNPRALGYHYTSLGGFRDIAKKGLGRAPGSRGWVEEHEIPYWLSMSYLPQSTAARIAILLKEGMVTSAGQALSRALARQRGLKVAWFYRDVDHEGTTAGDRDACVKFNLAKVGDWLVDNADTVHEFTDDAQGYPGFAVAWIGPAIPPSLLSACKRRPAYLPR